MAAVKPDRGLQPTAGTYDLGAKKMTSVGAATDWLWSLPLIVMSVVIHVVGFREAVSAFLFAMIREVWEIERKERRRSQRHRASAAPV
jgi:hypothetical protein